MDLYIYDESISLIGITDIYGSLMWIRRASSAGAFELHVPADPHNIAVLQPHRYVYRPDVDEAMYISTIKEAKTDEGNTLTVSGYTLDGLYRKRKLPDNIDKRSLFKTLEKCSSFGCKTVFLDPNGYDSRKIDNSSIDSTESAEDYMRYVLKKLGCQMAGRLNIYDGQLEFTLVKSRDLSDRLIFSEDYDNLTNSTYEFSEEGCANTIYGRCNDPGDDVEKPNGLPRYTLGDDKHGLASTEKVIYVDPVVELGLRVVYDVDGVPEFEEYNYVNYDKSLAALKEKCDAEAKKYTENFTADVMISDLYRSTFDVGDTVAIQNDLRNTRYYKPIEEVEETFDETGHYVTPTFGEPLKTIYDFIKY